MPAACSAWRFDSAVPPPPEMIAPACPIRRPGGAVRPAMKAAIGFFHSRPRGGAAPVEGGPGLGTLARAVGRGAPLFVAADLADEHDRLGLRIGVEHLERV